MAQLFSLGCAVTRIFMICPFDQILIHCFIRCGHPQRASGDPMPNKSPEPTARQEGIELSDAGCALLRAPLFILPWLNRRGGGGVGVMAIPASSDKRPCVEAHREFNSLRLRQFSETSQKRSLTSRWRQPALALAVNREGFWSSRVIGRGCLSFFR